MSSNLFFYYSEEHKCFISSMMCSRYYFLELKDEIKQEYIFFSIYCVNAIFTAMA